MPQQNNCPFGARRNCSREISGCHSSEGRLFQSRCLAAAKALQQWSPRYSLHCLDVVLLQTRWSREKTPWSAKYRAINRMIPKKKFNVRKKRRVASLSTPCPKKTCDYIFYNNFNNKCPITIIFGIVSSKSRRHRKMVSFPTSPI